MTTNYRSCWSALRETQKERTGKLENLIGDGNGTDAIVTSAGIFAVGPITTPKAEKTTPALTALVSEQTKDAFCGYGACPVGTPGLCYSYNLHSLLVHTVSLNGAVQIVVPISL